MSLHATILINGTIMSIIAIIIAYIIDKNKLYKNYAIAFIVMFPVFFTLAKFTIPAASGLSIPVVLGVMFYLTYKNLAYAEYITYIVYISIVLGDLIVGMVYTNLLKISLYEYFKDEKNTLIYSVFMFLASICIAMLNKYITEKKIKLKELEITKEAKTILSVCVSIALVSQMLIAHKTQSMGIQADMVRNSFFMNSAIVIIFMYTIFYAIQYSDKKFKKAKQIHNRYQKLPSERKKAFKENIDNLRDKELKEMLQDLFE